MRIAVALLLAALSLSNGACSYQSPDSPLHDRVTTAAQEEGVSRESIQSADLPLEARESIERQIDDRNLRGPLLGLVEVDRSEWHPLPDAVSVTEILYTWKQSGESVSVNVVRRGGKILIAAIR